MTSIQKWESDGFFLLSYMPEYIPSDDLGRGEALISLRFLTEEGRSYYISLNSSIEKLNKICESQESELRYLKTIKGANKNLKEVRMNNKRHPRIKGDPLN